MSTLVYAFIGFVIAGIAATAAAIVYRLPPDRPRRSKRCECPCCRCGDS